MEDPLNHYITLTEEVHQENQKFILDNCPSEQSQDPTEANIKDVKVVKVLGKGAQGLVVLCERDTPSFVSRFVLKIFTHCMFEKQS